MGGFIQDFPQPYFFSLVIGLDDILFSLIGDCQVELGDGADPRRGSKVGCGLVVGGALGGGVVGCFHCILHYAVLRDDHPVVCGVYELGVC